MDKEKIKKWFLTNFKTHTDWTGTYVEYNQKCNNIDELVNLFLKYMEE